MLDAGSTLVLLAGGEVRELNPWLSWVIETRGVVEAMAVRTTVGLLGLLALALTLPASRLAPHGLRLVTVVLLAVCGWHGVVHVGVALG